MNSTTQFKGSLNESQTRHLVSSCQHIDKLLLEIEGILSSASSNAVFPKYKNDLSAVQIKTARDYLARVRAQMLQSLKGIGIEPPPAQFGAIHSVRVTLMFATIAVEDCSPKKMRGYGELADSIVPHLTGLLEEIQTAIGQLDSYFKQGLGQDLEGRLQKLADSGGDVDLLKRLERIVNERGMVEYRSSVALILERIETQTFEIAIFGRVSSGKSSLLNHILEADILPVGVNPVTAVPTRLLYGPQPSLTVSYAMKNAERLPVERLAEFATERHNRANEKHVTRIVVELPSPRLREGVVLVDTPGLGSLAASGSAETLAYLPRCDHGVVLIDSGSTLTSDDLSTIQLLYEAGIPSSVLLSKADLLKPEDRQRALEYTGAQIREKLGLALPVHPVSVAPGQEELLQRWFEEQIHPLYERHRELAVESTRRKIGALRERIEAALESQRRGRSNQSRQEPSAEQAETALRLASGKFEQARELCLEQTDAVKSAGDSALARAAESAAEEWKTHPSQTLGAEWLSALLVRIASEYTSKLAVALQQLAEDLAGTIEERGTAMNQDVSSVRREFTAALRDMPMLDLGTLQIDLRSGFWDSISAGLAKSHVEKQLRNGVREEISGAFASYARVLEAWTRKTLQDLRTRFEGYAESYRVELGRTAGTAIDLDQREAIRRDLDSLRSELAPAVR